MRLAQTTVSPRTLRKLDGLARATRRTRADYLRLLIEMHVRATNPRLELSLNPPDEEPR